jgi:hypothetical protein
MPSAEL